MEINVTERHLKTDNTALSVVNYLSDNAEVLHLGEAQLYYDFPIFRDDEDAILAARLLVVSREHGVVVISPLSIRENIVDQIVEADATLDKIFSLLFSRLVRVSALRKSRTELAFPNNTIIYATFDGLAEGIKPNSILLRSLRDLEGFFEGTRIEPIPESIFQELIATIEGAKGLARPKPRTITPANPNSKGNLASLIESDIASFDQRQKHGYMTFLDGLQRIRGLAGSGKTVVLAMKAALTHLRNPEATLLYTFYTRSLYQQVEKLITRFYRQFDDGSPDWNKIKIMHAWGGQSTPGVYYNATLANGVTPISFSQASARSGDPFDFVCKSLIEQAEIKPAYDFVFIDEAQDFPASFIQLCLKLSERDRVVFAYDDLQTIFQANTPALEDIVGVDKEGKPSVELTEDTILYKCYRNPREIIVVAHALGFGLYGSRIVQMLEQREQWEDIGYQVVTGDFVESSEIIIRRPVENSLSTISDHEVPTEIVQATVFESYAEEIRGVAESIKRDIDDGLRPDDILVAVVDDRHARNYLRDLAEDLLAHGIKSNNIHTDDYGIRDFYKDGFVTLSTVHKAKGNEAFMVYVVGVDALFTTYAGVRERNVLFTAMTRAKGWVRVSGVGEGAIICQKEIETALQNFPDLKFKYPSPEQLKIVRRDLAEKAIRKLQAERKLDEILEEMSASDIERFIRQRSIRKIGSNKNIKKDK